ncbi:cupin domain-containing protein [Siminovitchia sediminis]|uniref:Cupin domain-containing protein n=1 Tax=Siminovitchia sediminis TaxID=1274353 RepID=A0ABW4KNC3_9BACI
MMKNLDEYLEFHEDRFVRKNLFQEGKTTAFLLNFLPGQTIPPHPHPNAHIYLTVIQGKGTCTIGEKEFFMSQNDMIHCTDEQMLSIENTGNEPLSILCVMAKD